MTIAERCRKNVRIALRWLHDRQIPKASRKCCGLWASLGGHSHFDDSEFESFLLRFCISYLPRFPGGSRTIQDVSLAWIYAGPASCFVVEKRADIHRKPNDRPGNYFMVLLAVNLCQFMNEVSCVFMCIMIPEQTFRQVSEWDTLERNIFMFFSLEACVRQVHFMIWRLANSQPGVPPRESCGGARRCIKSSIRRVQFGYCTGRGPAAQHRAYHRISWYSILPQHVTAQLSWSRFWRHAFFALHVTILQYTWLTDMKRYCIYNICKS